MPILMFNLSLSQAEQLQEIKYYKISLKNMCFDELRPRPIQLKLLWVGFIFENTNQLAPLPYEPVKFHLVAAVNIVRIDIFLSFMI